MQQAKAMVSDDFSFPKMSYELLPNLVVASPSLWRVSSLVYPAADYCEREVDYFTSKNFSYLEDRKNNSTDHACDCEEKMDMLWEDFNEELQSRDGIDMNKKDKEAAVKLSNISEADAEELCCQLQALKMSRTANLAANGMINDKTPSNTTTNTNTTPLVVRFLKKLFSISNSTSQIKKIN